MNQIISSVLASRAANMANAANFAHLLAEVLLLPDTGIFNAAKLIAMKESRTEVIAMVTTAGDVFVSTMQESTQSITMYDMRWLQQSFTVTAGTQVEEFLQFIADQSATGFLPAFTYQESDFEALTRSKNKADGVHFDGEEFFITGLLGAPVFMRIDVDYPDAYEGKREEEVQA